jgi:hypothetical protein
MRELVRFGRMFLADGVGEDGTRILPPGTFAAMREPRSPCRTWAPGRRTRGVSA